MKPLQDLDDKALFSLIMEGNHRAYAEFYARYCISMGNQAYKLLGDREVAADILQDVFTQLWEYRDSLVEVENPRYYLYQMMRNRAVKQLLTVKKEHLALQDLASYLQEMQAHSGPADEAISAQQLQEAIDREVANLPERMRAVFLLRRDEQLSHQEIADRLGISVLTSRTQLKKAVKYLWSKLSTLFALALAWYLWL